jgi:hypothetical protein
MIGIAGQQIAQHIICRDEHIVERNRPGIGAAPAELFLIFLDLKAFIFGLHDHAAIALFDTIARACAA